MDNDFEESDCEEMPNLNLTGSAVQPYMFEPTKGTEGEKSASGSEENSDSDDDLETYHMDLMQTNLTRTKKLNMLVIGKFPIILQFFFLVRWHQIFNNL